MTLFGTPQSTSEAPIDVRDVNVALNVAERQGPVSQNSIKKEKKGSK